MASAINSTSIALIDASIPVLGVVSAVAVAITEPSDDSEDPVFKIDPSGEELNEATSWHIIAYEIKQGEITRLLLCESSGSFTKPQLFKALELAAEGCLKVYQHFETAIEKKLENDFYWAK